MGSHAKRLVAGALALSLAAISVTSYVSWRRERDRLLQMLDGFGTGPREPGVISDLRREPDPLRSRLLVARALLADELDRRWLNELNQSERESAEGLSLRKLDSALALAREVLAAQPASWQARMILAGSTYLRMSRLSDPLRWRERFRWEQPLRDAISMASSQVEPRRILAAAYLNDWSLMTPAERESARDVLRVAFRDRATLEQLLPSWLRRAETLDQALDLMPVDTSSWLLIEDYFSTRQDWERVCKARMKRLSLLPDYLERTLSEAEMRLQGGDSRHARALALLALRDTPVGPIYSETLERILRALPAGPLPSPDQKLAKLWLEWARRECLLAKCPISTNVIQRLRTLSQSASSADRAWIAELAGDSYAAEAYERDSFVLHDPAWSPYLLLKAKRLAASRREVETLRALAQVHPDWADRAVTKAVVEFVRNSLKPSPSKPTASWENSSVLTSNGVSSREFFWLEPPGKARLRFENVPSSGAAVEISWSDRWSACHGVDRGAILTLAAPDDSGYHVLQVRPLVGTRLNLAQIEIIREARSAPPTRSPLRPSE